MNTNSMRKMTQTAMIAALYAAITFATFYMSFGAVQFRVSEALTLLPVFTSSAIPGLSIGCALANLIGFFIGANPIGWLDAIFGTSATLLAACATWLIGKSSNRWVRYLLAPLPPVLFNAVIVGLEITFLVGGTDAAPSLLLFTTNAVSVFIGQAVICYGLGIPLMLVLSRRDFYKRLFI